MRALLQVLVGGTGVVAMVISLLHIVFGPACIPGTMAVNATLDSEDRFYAVFFFAYGWALLWCARDVEQKREPLRLLGALFFAGGVTRLISMLAMGAPHGLFIALTPIELGLPLTWWILQARLSATTPGAPATQPTPSSQS